MPSADGRRRHTLAAAQNGNVGSNPAPDVLGGISHYRLIDRWVAEPRPFGRAARPSRAPPRNPGRPTGPDHDRLDDRRAASADDLEHPDLEAARSGDRQPDGRAPR